VIAPAIDPADVPVITVAPAEHPEFPRHTDNAAAAEDQADAESRVRHEIDPRIRFHIGASNAAGAR
jgi:hypothetical protein